MTFRSCPSFSLQKIFREDASKAHIFPEMGRKAHRDPAIGRMAKKVLCDRLE